MSIYLLDTSILVDILRNQGNIADFIQTPRKRRSEKSVEPRGERTEGFSPRQFISAHTADAFVTSAICEMEINLGLHLSRSEKVEERKKQAEKLFSSLYEVIPFDSEQARVAAQIKSDLLKRGEMVEDLDILITAAAFSRHATLLTNNLKHFSRINGLDIKTP